MVGDPHITTLDGKHYTLLSQGTFSHLFPVALAWRQSCIQKLPEPRNSQSIGKSTSALFRPPVLHEGLASRRQVRRIRQVLEITSQDCKWKARKGNGDWKVVDNAELSIPDGKDYVTAFDLGGSSRSWWPWLSQPCSLQHVHQE